jgi:hypothetical protein
VIKNLLIGTITCISLSVATFAADNGVIAAAKHYDLKTEEGAEAFLREFFKTKGETVDDAAPFVEKTLNGKTYLVTKASIEMMISGTQRQIVLGYVISFDQDFMVQVNLESFNLFLKSGDTKYLPQAPDLKVE